MNATDVLTEEQYNTFLKVEGYIKRKEWGIGKYHTKFLALMITLRKSYREETEKEEDIPKMPQLASEAMDLMPAVYKKHKVLKVGWKKSLADLDAALSRSGIPEEYLIGETVSSTVKKLDEETEFFKKS